MSINKRISLSAPHMSSHEIPLIQEIFESNFITPVEPMIDRFKIKTHPVWKPMHMQPVFKKSRYIGETVAEELLANGLCLPSGTGLSDNDILFVAEKIKTLLNNKDLT